MRSCRQARRRSRGAGAFLPLRSRSPERPGSERRRSPATTGLRTLDAIHLAKPVSSATRWVRRHLRRQDGRSRETARLQDRQPQLILAQQHPEDPVAPRRIRARLPCLVAYRLRWLTHGCERRRLRRLSARLIRRVYEVGAGGRGGGRRRAGQKRDGERRRPRRPARRRRRRGRELVRGEGMTRAPPHSRHAPLR